MALARHRSPHGAGVSVGVWTAEGLCLLEAARAAGALWHHEVFHRRLGGLRAASGCRAASRGEGEHPENREQAHQSTDPHQAVSASDAVLFQDGTDARSGDWTLHLSLSRLNVKCQQNLEIRYYGTNVVTSCFLECRKPRELKSR